MLSKLKVHADLIIHEVDCRPGVTAVIAAFYHVRNIEHTLRFALVFDVLFEPCVVGWPVVALGVCTVVGIITGFYRLVVFLGKDMMQSQIVSHLVGKGGIGIGNEVEEHLAAVGRVGIAIALVVDVIAVETQAIGEFQI